MGTGLHHTRSKHSPPIALPEPQQESLDRVDRLLALTPIPGPKPWEDSVERAAIWHAAHSAPPQMALCASGVSYRSAQEYLSDDPPVAYRSACAALRERLKEAELACAAGLFANIHKAAQDPRYWTAAAWTLERKHGYVAQVAGLTGPTTVVNIGQVNVIQANKGDTSKLHYRDDPEVIDAASLAVASSSTD